MSTRGAIGFIVGGVTKVTYNHSDSYPSELGRDVLKYIAGTPLATMQGDAARIALISEDAKPTPEQIAACSKYTDLGVSNQSTQDWYCLLRNAQGSLAAYAEIGLMIDGHKFLEDSLFCEWAYIINLDTDKLEVYRGFNKNRKAAGRYAKLKEKPWKRNDGVVIKPEYCGVVLIAEEPLSPLRELFGNKFAKVKADHLVGRLTEGWTRIARDQREAEQRVADEKAALKKSAKALRGK